MKKKNLKDLIFIHHSLQLYENSEFFFLSLLFMEVKQRKNIFYSRCFVKDMVCSLTIDRKSYINMASTSLVEKLSLHALEHPEPYSLNSLEDPEFSEMGSLMVDRQVLVSFKVDGYEDEVLCDVVPTKTRHLSLGWPWKRQRKAKHDCSTNKYSFLFKNTKITLVPFEQEEGYKDPMYMERESEENREIKESDEKDENFQEEERFSSDEKESGEQKGEIFLHNPQSFDAGSDLRSNHFQENGNDDNMDGFNTSKADIVPVPITLVPRPHLKYFCDPNVGKLFIDSDLKFYDEVKNNQIEEARLVFDPGNLWSHSYKKRYLKSKFLFEEYYEDLRTNPGEEGENDVIMSSLSMWKEFYKDI